MLVDDSLESTDLFFEGSLSFDNHVVNDAFLSQRHRIEYGFVFYIDVDLGDVIPKLLSPALQESLVIEKLLENHIEFTHRAWSPNTWSNTRGSRRSA